MNKKEIRRMAARYPKFVEWVEEDACFVGRCPDLFEGGLHGTDEAKVYKQVCEAAEEWIELLQADQTKLPPGSAATRYSGKFVVRVDPAIHRRVALKAKLAGESLNAFVTRALLRSG